MQDTKSLKQQRRANILKILKASERDTVRWKIIKKSNCNLSHKTHRRKTYYKIMVNLNYFLLSPCLLWAFFVHLLHMA